MDYEKKYKEALEIAQKLYQDCPNGKNDRLYHTTDLEKMFPELCESEDEKIRKELIEHVKDQQSSFISAPDCRDKYEEEENDKYNSWLAWLEKQGEQSSLNINRECLKGIKRVQEYQDLSDWEKEFDKIASMYAHNKNQEGYNDSWYVKERAAEMLYYAKKELEKQGGQKPSIEMIAPEESLGIDSETYNEIVNTCIFGENKPKFKVGDWLQYRNAKPFFVEEITKQGYVNGDSCLPFNWENEIHLWTIQDAKDGDVLTNGDFPCIFKRCDDNGSLYVYCGINAHNDFSILSENPENVWDDYSKQYFPATKEQRDTLFAKMKESGYEWLEETKELKKIEQKPAEWKQENVEELSEFENAMMHIGYSFFGKRGGLDPNDTSSVKVQAQYLLELAQKSAEWSEEDEKILKAIHNSVDVECLSKNGLDYIVMVDWLKSLKQRIGG